MHFIKSYQKTPSQVGQLIGRKSKDNLLLNLIFNSF